MKFGKLTVLEYTDKDRYGNWNVKCACDCGKIKVCRAATLNAGRANSCGCSRLGMGTRKRAMQAEERKPRKKQKRPTRLYRIWTAMKQRCYNPNHKAWSYYGGRGISVCDEWKNSFSSFMDWSLKNGYAENLSIDRMDGEGNYEPSNCRWVTQSEQNRNRNYKRDYGMR